MHHFQYQSSSNEASGFRKQIFLQPNFSDTAFYCVFSSDFGSKLFLGTVFLNFFETPQLL